MTTQPGWWNLFSVQLISWVQVPENTFHQPGCVVIKVNQLKSVLKKFTLDQTTCYEKMNLKIDQCMKKKCFA